MEIEMVKNNYLERTPLLPVQVGFPLEALLHAARDLRNARAASRATRSASPSTSA